MFLIEVEKKEDITDAEGKELTDSISEMGFKVKDIKVSQLYFIEGKINKKVISKISKELLTDPVIERFKIYTSKYPSIKNFPFQWEVIKTLHKGVTDNTGETTLKAIKAMGIKNIYSITTGKRFMFDSNLTEKEIKNISLKILSNPIIESVSIRRCKK